MRLLHLLLSVEQRLLVLTAHAAAVVAIGLHHLCKRRRHLQLWHLAAVQIHACGAVVERLHHKVGRHLLQAATLRLAECGAGLGVEAAYLVAEVVERVVAHVVGLAQRVPVFGYEVFVAVGEDACGETHHGRLLTSLEL